MAGQSRNATTFGNCGAARYYRRRKLHTEPQFRLLRKKSQMTESLVPTSTNNRPLDVRNATAKWAATTVLAPTNEEKSFCCLMQHRGDKAFHQTRLSRHGTRGFIHAVNFDTAARRRGEIVRRVSASFTSRRVVMAIQKIAGHRKKFSGSRQAVFSMKIGKLADMFETM